METTVEKTKQATPKLEKTGGEKENQLRGPAPNTIYTEAYVTTLAKFIYLPEGGRK